MEHITDIKLLDYVAGKLTTPESEQVRQHIATCGACASRYQDTAAVWNVLGKWRVDTSAHPVASRIETLAAERQPDQQPRRTVLIPFRKSMVAALRVAAAIVIAVAGGHLLGRYSAARNAPDTPTAENGPRYIAALGFEWSSELTWTVLQEDVPSGANQR
jgi:anti-sigma factor RsiW